MATLSDLKEMKEALDAGLVSQADFDDVKRDYLRAKKKALVVEKENLEVKKQELRAKKKALEANKEFQKKELRAKEEALEANKEFQKRELRTKEDFQKKELLAKEAFQQRKSEADLRAYALESIVKHGSSIMSEEQKADLVRDYAKMSGLDGVAENDARASKRQRPLAEERDTSPPQPPTPPAPAAAVPPPADAPTPADEDEYSNYSDGDGEDDSDYDEPRAAKQTKSCKKWIEEDDAALVAALRAGQRLSTIKIRGRSGQAAQDHLRHARENGSGSPALREYLEETCPGYVYRGPPKGTFGEPWSAEEDQTFIQAHREGKTHGEIAAMLPGRSHSAVGNRWREVKIGKTGTAALKAYVAEYCKAAASQSQVPSVPRPRTGPPPLDDSCQTTRVDQSRPVLLRLDVLEGAPEAVECRLDVLPVQSVPDEQRPDDE